MRIFVKFILLLFILIQPLRANNLQNVVDSLSDYSIDSLREISVENFEIPVRYGQVILNRGKLYLTGYHNELPTAAYFLGDGRFNYYPPEKNEIQQVHRFYFSDSVDVEFDQAYFAFPWNSEFLAEQKSLGKFVEPAYRVKSYLKAIRSIPDDKFRYNLPLNIYKSSIENQPEFLWIDLLKERYHHTVYFYDPYSTEQVGLYKYTSNFKTPQIVSSVVDRYAEPSKINGNQFDLNKYDIFVDISTIGNSAISCAMSIESRVDSLKFLQFNFPRKYRIDSIKGALVDSTSFIKNKNRPGFTVELADFLSEGEYTEIAVFYQTNLFRHYMHYGAIQDHLTHWYPYNGHRQQSEYNIGYCIDKGFDFFSVGEMMADSTVGDKKYLHFKTDPSSAYISFNYGVFDSVVVFNDSIPIIIHFLKSDRPSVIFGKNNIADVVEDISGSFRFYNDSLAPYPLKRLDIASMAVGFGQGSPGLVHLSKTTFNRSKKGIDDKFRAHEVAHQWWGHLINPKGYRDVWLSEGFAEYSAALYIELVKNDKRTFGNILKDWKKAIIRGTNYQDKKSIGYKSGAIILGHRLGSEMSPGDFETIVYYKAAYLLHMLRYELEVYRGKKGAFIDLLSEFAKKYAEKLVSTEEFIDLTEFYFGDNVYRFFDQWLYDWRVPKIRKNDKINRDGSVNISIMVDKVGKEFVTPYPVRIQYNDKTEKTMIYRIKSGQNEFVFSPPAGKVVKSIRYNPDLDILEQ